MSDQLVTCPDCGTRNFSPRGLKSHRGNKHCRDTAAILSASNKASPAAPPAIRTKSAKTAPVGVRTLELHDLEVLPMVPVVVLGPWERTRRWVDTAGVLDRCKVACQVMAGYELAALKKAHGSTQGRRTDLTSPNDSEKLSWPELVKEKLGISTDTARNWMAMAEAAKSRLKKLGGADAIAAILDKPASEWEPGEAKKIETTVHKISDGKTQLDFMTELGLVKSARGSGSKGGHKPGDGKQKIGKEEALDAEAQRLHLAAIQSMFAIRSDANAALVLRLGITTDDPAKIASLTHGLTEAKAVVALYEKALLTARKAASK